MSGWRRLSIQIPIADYVTLQHLAARDERQPDRQAAKLLRERLTDERESIEAVLAPGRARLSAGAGDAEQPAAPGVAGVAPR